MFQRYGQFPGYTIQERVDSPRYYERFLATENSDPRNWCMIRCLNKELAGTAELRLCYQDACRHYAHFHLDGLVPVREMGMSRTHGFYIAYAYDFSYLSLGEISALFQRDEIRVNPAFMMSVLLDAVRILETAHANRLDHFGVLPPDIIVSPNGEVYVKGFVEVAMRRRYHFETEMLEKFEAPEWRRHETVGVESDVYAISSFLYQSLTNELQPDEWEPRWMGMMDVLNRSGVPGEALSAMMSFFQHTLAERPQQRLSSYGQLAQSLERLVGEFGGYQPREVRAEVLKGHFDDFPPRMRADSCEFRSDVINLITGELPTISAEIPEPSEEHAVLTGLTGMQRREAPPESSGGSGGDISFEETLTSSPIMEGIETRVLHRSSNSFRTINPNLRASIHASPLEVLARSRYQILDELGSGGTGTVYKVLDTTLTEVLALKVLKPELVSDAAWLQRFKRELKITRDLEHAYILPAYHLEQLEGLYFFTMRYIDGKNLSEHLHESSLPLMMSMRILTQVAEALVAAHDRGVIHRDLKPANIMVETGTYHPYLMDFGIASTLDMPSLTIEGQGIGTPYYMAPEQSRGEQITIQADVYSFGVVCYECFTQKLPFIGSTAVAIYTAQQSGIFEPIRNLNPMVPPSIAKVVESCLAPQAQNRPASMRVVLDGLGRMG